MHLMNTLRFGTAGIPISAKGGTTLDGIKKVHALGLATMELEFVHSVNISEEKAPLVKKEAKEQDVALTCHGQYYINLNAKEPAKLAASKERVLKAARIASLCGAWSLTFHGGFYLGMEKETVYKNIKKSMQEIMNTLKDEGNTIWVRPETTGKESQWGSIQEILRLSEEVEGVMPCIDFAHLHARSIGKYNTREEIHGVLSDVEKTLGKKGLHNMHIHMAGIAYGEKGERNHLILNESTFNYQAVLKELKNFKVRGSVICESPNLEEDALLLQKTFSQV